MADYSYIFHRLRNDDEGLIYLDIKQVTFIQFLNENFNAQLSTLRLKKVNPIVKQNIYNQHLERYKNAGC